MANYQSSHTGAEIDEGVTRGLLVPKPTASDTGKVPTVNSAGTGFELSTPSGGSGKYLYAIVLNYYHSSTKIYGRICLNWVTDNENITDISSFFSRFLRKTWV